MALEARAAALAEELARQRPRRAKIGLADRIAEALANMSKEGKPLGGAPAFDPVACTEHLGNGGVYECCVSLAAFGIFEFNYPANPPMVGSNLAVQKHR